MVCEYWGLNKMPDIVPVTFSKVSPWKINLHSLIQSSLKKVPEDVIDDKSAVVQVMAWYKSGTKPLPGLIMNQFTDAYQWLSARLQ